MDGAEAAGVRNVVFQRGQADAHALPGRHLRPPPKEVAAQLRAELEAELAGGEPTGMRPQRREGELHYTQRWAIAVGRKPAHAPPAKA